MYFYDSGNAIRKFGAEAITVGNVVSGPHQLYDAGYVNTSYGQWLDRHEKAHYFDQSPLGVNYLPVQMISQWGSHILQRVGYNVDPFMEYAPFHSSGYGASL